MSASSPDFAKHLAPPTPLNRWDAGLLGVLAATAALLVWSWARQEGYQIADSVEYLERAQGIALGEKLVDSVAIRGFGFSGLLVPLFWISDLFGLREPVRIMQAAQLLQVLLTLALVAATARLCAKFVGREGGLAAGALVGFNPIVLRWGVEPVSGIAAALFITLAVSRAVGERRPTFSLPRRGAVSADPPPAPRMQDAWWTGALLGLAFLMAYQTTLVICGVLAVLVVRDLRRHARWIAAVLASLLGVVLVQCALDRWYYGAFGISVETYLIENFGSGIARLIHAGGVLPVVGKYFYAVSQWMYNGLFGVGANTHAYQQSVAEGQDAIKLLKPYDWYFTHITLCFVAPAAVLVGFGLLRGLLTAFRATAILWFVALAFAGAMSTKGSKDFRLWLPVLPLVAALGGIGFCALFTKTRALQVAGAVTLGATLVLAAFQYRATNTKKYGGYWRAISFVNEHAAATRPERKPAAQDAPPAKLRLSAAYHWSMFLRESHDVQLIKLPHQLDLWKSYDAETRAQDFALLATLDAFITHLPVLTQNPDLFEAINRDFAVAAAYYDRVVYDSLGPIYVLLRRTPERPGLCFFEREEGRTLEDLARESGHGPLLEFEHAQGDVDEKLALVEARYTPLAGDGHGWISYVWHGGPLAPPDWTILDRLTAPDHENSWQNNHQPGYGMVATSTWAAGTTLREGYLVVAEANPFFPDVVYHRLGGAYRRGNLLPLTLWIDVVHLDEAGKVASRMDALDPLTAERVADVAPTPDLASPCGATTLPDGMTRAKSLFVPLHPAARRADDGAPVPLTEPR
ncbi:MAG TPA: hypothetical protein VM509_13305 [Planctomycetota bacterium]|nr:hypothetical protein [Planctomycetota bacterium]